MNEEDLKYYFRKIVEGFEQANNSLLSIMTRIHCDYLTLDEVLVWLEEDIRTIHKK